MNILGKHRNFLENPLKTLKVSEELYFPNSEVMVGNTVQKLLESFRNVLYVASCIQLSSIHGLK